jgi:Sec-independent protein translocase protein TatA
MSPEKLKKLQDVLPWWTKAWLWFRRWGWVPIAVLLVIVAFVVGGFLLRKNGKIVINPLRDIRKAIDENNRRIDAELVQAEYDKEAEIARIEKEHADTIAKLDADQQARREELRANPRRLARWLTNLTDE